MKRTKKLVSMWFPTKSFPGHAHHVGRVLQDDDGNEFVLNFQDNKIYTFEELKAEGVECYVK